MNKAMLALIRLVFITLSRVAPNQAGRLAFRLFCTTFKANSKSAQHQKILALAKMQYSEATRHTISYSGGTVAAFEFNAKAKPQSVYEQSSQGVKTENQNTVLLVHGWQSHAGFMYKFIEPLRQQGLRVIAIDLPGHGSSSGRLFHLPLAVEAVHAVQQTLGGFNRIISHSLGGAVTATILAGTLSTNTAPDVEAAVLISSPDSMSKIFNDFSEMIALNSTANAALHDNVTRLSGRSTDDFNVATQLQLVDTQILLIHAPDDKEVPFTEAQSIARANERVTLKPVDGLGHRRIIADDHVVNTAIEFVSRART